MKTEKEKTWDFKLIPDTKNPFKSLSIEEKLRINMLKLDGGTTQEFYVEKIKKDSFTATTDSTNYFPSIFSSDDDIFSVDISPAGRELKEGEIYAIFLLQSSPDGTANINFLLQRVFRPGYDVILRNDDKESNSEYFSSIRIKNCRPEDIILGRLVKVNGKAV